MKREEFFEALSDIDEDLVAGAKCDEASASPVIVTPKKSLVKPICAGAACAVLTAGLVAAVALNAGGRPGSTVTPGTGEPTYKTSITAVNTSRYPEVLYPYTGDYSNLEIKYLCDEYPLALSKQKYKSYDELAEDSSLIVVGTFIDNSNQSTDNHDSPNFSQVLSSSSFNKYVSLNTFKVEKVLKSDGQVWEDDEIVIAQPYVNADGSMYSLSQLTPMIKGDKWVYFLNQYSVSYPEENYGKGAYYAVNDYEGRYPVPGSENTPFLYRENTNGVVAPAVFNQSVYSELSERIAAAKSGKHPTYEAESKKVTSIAEELNLERWPVGINIEFEMGEFDGEVFGMSDGELYVRKSDSEREACGGPGFYLNMGSTYLCDLNGDGKREICTEVSFGSGIVSNFILVFDHANDKQYALSARGELDYFLRERNGELEYLSSPFDMSMTMYPDENAVGELLTMDVLKELETEPNEDMSAATEMTHKKVTQIMDLAYASSNELRDIPVEFDMEEFPDVLFLREPDDVYGDGLYVTEGDSEGSIPVFRCKSISSIYICDLNGDGKCEIAAGIRLTDKYGSDKMVGKSIVVIDYANNCAYLLSDEENFTYTLSDEYDTLYVNKFDDKLDRDLFLAPLTLDMMRSDIAVGNGVMFQLPISDDEKPAETEAPSSDTEKISFSKDMGGYSICVGIEAVKCMHGKDCYDLLQHENNIYIKDSSGSVIYSRAFPWEINIAPEADSTELTFEVLEFDGGNILAMGFPVNVNGEQCRRMSFFYFDNSSITFALVGDEFIFDETHPVIRGDLWQEDDCVCFTSRSTDGGFDGCHYLTDFGNCRFTHCAGADPTLHKLNHNHDHDHENHNHDHESGQQDESYIELDVHPYEEVIGGEKGGHYSFDYDGTLYRFPIVDSVETYIIDKDNDIFAPINEAMEFNPESRIDAAMKDIAGYYENFEYVGKIRDTYLGGLTIDEGYVYRHGDDLIILYNCDNAVRYNLDTCERLFNIKFTDEERHDLLARKIDFEETLLKYGVKYDPGIYYVAILYEPEEE